MKRLLLLTVLAAGAFFLGRTLKVADDKECPKEQQEMLPLPMLVSASRAVVTNVVIVTNAVLVTARTEDEFKADCVKNICAYAELFEGRDKSGWTDEELAAWNELVDASNARSECALWMCTKEYAELNAGDSLEAHNLNVMSHARLWKAKAKMGDYILLRYFLSRGLDEATASAALTDCKKACRHTGMQGGVEMASQRFEMALRVVSQKDEVYESVLPYKEAE